MEVVKVVMILSQLLGQVEQAVRAARAVSDLVKQARAEDRDITKEELEELLMDDDAARDLLDQAIAEAELEQEG